jgi:hypothetical protein
MHSVCRICGNQGSSVDKGNRLRMSSSKFDTGWSFFFFSLRTTPDSCLMSTWCRVYGMTAICFFIFAAASRQALGPTQPPIQRVPRAVSLGIKQLGVKLTTHLRLVPRLTLHEAISPLLHTFSWRGACLSIGYVFMMSRDSSVGIATRLRALDDWGSKAPFQAGAGNFSLHHRVQNGSGAHPASYPRSTRCSFPGGKAAGAWSWSLAFI